MRKWLLVIAVLVFGGALSPRKVEARRLGGGRTIGAQRNVTTPPRRRRPSRRSSRRASQQGAQQAAPAQGGSRWMPILGGLALGGMLGYLFGGSGSSAFCCSRCWRSPRCSGCAR